MEMRRFIPCTSSLPNGSLFRPFELESNDSLTFQESAPIPAHFRSISESAVKANWRIVNFAHGSLFMIGAYIGFSVAAMDGFWGADPVISEDLAALRTKLDDSSMRARRLQRRTRSNLPSSDRLRECRKGAARGDQLVKVRLITSR